MAASAGRKDRVGYEVGAKVRKGSVEAGSDRGFDA
jgi:hypothetical protein